MMRLALGAGLLLCSALTSQDSQVAIPGDVMDLVGDLLPERSNSGASFASDVYSPNVIVSDPAEIEVIFVWEGAGYRNTLGYFTYTEGADGSVTVVDSNLVIPNASFPPQGGLQTGDTFTLKNANGTTRVFQPGERVGFFVVADGWNMEPLIPQWANNGIAAAIPAATGQQNAQFGRGCYTSISRMNPEFATGDVAAARHLAMIWMPAEAGFLGGLPYLLSGFEDLNRTSNSDDDFNDLVFIVTASPITAIDQTQAFEFQPDDTDLDGVSGLHDHFPNDPDRAFRRRAPTHGQLVLGFEDRYPWLGDADYNDVVLACDFEIISNSANLITDVIGTVHLLARGAAYEHSVGIHIPGLNSGVTGNLTIERFLSVGDGVHELPTTVSLSELPMASGRRIANLFASTQAALPPEPNSVLTNTRQPEPVRMPASCRFRLALTTPITQVQLGNAPWDIYVDVIHGADRWDVHRPGRPSFDYRPGSLPLEDHVGSYLDATGAPWLFEVAEGWRFPLESVPVHVAYPRFSSWASSGGQLNADWFEHPTSNANLISATIASMVPHREWTLQLP